MSDVLALLASGDPLPGRHLLVTAHPDDETISTAALLCAAQDLTILQLTTGADDDEAAESRRRERIAAFAAAGWMWTVVEAYIPDRQAFAYLERALMVLRDILPEVDVVWTHPYEAGHLDHDTAAWLVQEAAGATIRMESASYYLDRERHVFGDFWPDETASSQVIALSPEARARKRAAMAAYTSQSAILRKFPMPEREVYRVAPRYDFTRPAPPPRARWDIKGYRPTTAHWRQAMAKQAVAA